MESDSLPPLALYAHFPWCVRKCPYCDFNSHALHGDLPEAAYVDALLVDLDLQLEAAQGRELQSMFFGGGTPSLFAPAAIERLIAGIRGRLPLAADAEITLEANPGTIEHGRFTEYRAAGINRVSLGAQSFDPAQLQRLGRIHAADDTRRAVEELRTAGLANFNLDLMYALPEQSIDGALSDLNAAIALEPAHLSHYQLTLEPGTLFGARPPPGLPDPDAGADMMLACQARLAEAGFAQYEVSGYARAGRRCRHNLNYWRFGDYLGIGAGAHGKHSRRVDGSLVVARSARLREPRKYLTSIGERRPPEWLTVLDADLPFEFMMNFLRLTEGFTVDEFAALTGLPATVLAEPLARAGGRGLIERAGSRWQATPRGYAFLNELVAEFLPRA